MNYFLRYKYRFIALFVLLLLVTDLLLHKGIVRVLLPKKFPGAELFAQTPPPNITLINTNKQWVKAVNDPALLTNLPASAGGFETDVYFDTGKNYFDVHHDLNNSVNLDLETILEKYAALQLQCSIWLDFKNLSSGNSIPALGTLIRLRDQYGLKNKLVVESAYPAFLKSFADSGFYTSYYTPYFNPYLAGKDSLLHYIQTIKQELSHSNVQALSGYYFQAPFLHRYFPHYPLLTWGTNDRFSLVNAFYKWQVRRKTEIFIALYPQ